MADRRASFPHGTPDGEKPEFPLQVTFSDGHQVIIERMEGPETELEFYLPGERGSTVTDARGRKVHLKVWGCTLQECRLIEPPGTP